MKNIRNILALVLVFLMISCEEDWLDINENPNVPFVAQVDQLLTSAQTSLAYAQAGGVSNALHAYMHHIVVREQPDQYGMTASYGLLLGTWNNHYANVLPNLNAVIAFADDPENEDRYVDYGAVAKIMKAFSFTQLVDLWGDVPFTEATLSGEGIIHPAFDSGVDIYNACFDMLDEALTIIDDNRESLTKADVDGDLVYDGNIDSWERLANSLKLNLLLKTRKAKSDITGWDTKLTQVLDSEIGFIGQNEHFEVYFTPSTTPDQRHPSYGGNYIGSQLSQYFSPWFYEILNGYTYNASDNPFSGIQDPRRNFYYARQLASGELPDNPWEYKHGQFQSIFFASIGPFRDMGQDGKATTVGIYAMGGKWDDGNGGHVSGEGTGVAPSRFFIYPDLLFALTELAMTEAAVSGDAEALLEDAIWASFYHVDEVVGNNGTTQAVPRLGDEAHYNTVESYIELIMTRFELANDERKFEIVMTQKWIASFFNSIQSYADYRRTGYPVLFNPSADAITPESYEDFPEIIPTQAEIRAFPRSMWYPQREVELNPKIEQKANLSDAGKVFWDK